MPGNTSFLSPGVLFLSSSVGTEFKPLKQAFHAAHSKGYTRFVEPAAGAMAMCHVAQQVGWPPSSMEASDVMFLSAVLGAVAMGEDLSSLDVSAEGFEHEDLTSPAIALWVQAVLRADARGIKTHYWAEVGKSMRLERDRHVEGIQQHLDRLASVMGGIKYEALDMWDHLDRVADDPHTLISLNPPSITAGFEKFYDTGGKLTWNEPTYSIFSPVEGYARLTDYMSSSKALMAVYMESRSGDVEGAVFVRGGGRKAPGDTGISRSINYYVVSNRPDEFTDLSGGMMVESWPGYPLAPMSTPILPEAYEVTQDSKVVVLLIPGEAATYYRSLWTHGFVGASTPRSLGLFIDDHLAGIFGYDPQYVSSAGAFGKDSDSVSLVFGMTSPHNSLRLNRLLSRLALILYAWCSPTWPSTAAARWSPPNSPSIPSPRNTVVS